MAEILAFKKYTIFFLAIVICLKFQPTATRPIKLINNKKIAAKLHQMPPPAAPRTGFSGDLSDASKDDFRPTAPGYSPGVGHPKAVFSASKSSDSSTNDFRPTAPGNSPGVGHPKEVYTSSGKQVESTSSQSTTDFRPTNPGYSPGVGHSKEVLTGSNDSSNFNGTKDDYRPTQPGHSPGVGHKNL